MQKKRSRLTMNCVHDLQTSIWVLVPEAFKDKFHVTCDIELSKLRRRATESLTIRFFCEPEPDQCVEREGRIANPRSSTAEKMSP